METSQMHRKVNAKQDNKFKTITNSKEVLHYYEIHKKIFKKSENPAKTLNLLSTYFSVFRYCANVGNRIWNHHI